MLYECSVFHDVYFNSFTFVALCNSLSLDWSHTQYPNPSWPNHLQCTRVQCMHASSKYTSRFIRYICWGDMETEYMTPSFPMKLAYMHCTGYFDQNDINKIMEESIRMKRFNHPNVLTLIGVCIDASTAPYVITPYMANGSLLAYLRRERKDLIMGSQANKELVG